MGMKYLKKEQNTYALHALVLILFCSKNRQKNYPQVYLEQCKYKVKKREMKSSIDCETDLDPDYESD